MLADTPLGILFERFIGLRRGWDCLPRFRPAEVFLFLLFRLCGRACSFSTTLDYPPWKTISPKGTASRWVAN